MYDVRYMTTGAGGVPSEWPFILLFSSGGAARGGTMQQVSVMPLTRMDCMPQPAGLVAGLLRSILHYSQLAVFMYKGKN